MATFWKLERIINATRWGLLGVHFHHKKQNTNGSSWWKLMNFKVVINSPNLEWKTYISKEWASLQIEVSYTFKVRWWHSAWMGSAEIWWEISLQDNVQNEFVHMTHSSDSALTAADMKSMTQDEVKTWDKYFPKLQKLCCLQCACQQLSPQIYTVYDGLTLSHACISPPEAIPHSSPLAPQTIWLLSVRPASSSWTGTHSHCY